MATTQETVNASRLAFYDNRPIATVMQSAGVSITSSGTLFTPVGFDTTQTDNWNGHSTSVNNSRYTVQVAGVYSVTFAITLPANGTGIRASQLLKNGAVQAGTELFVPASSGSSITEFLPPFALPLVVGDYVEAGCFQNSGSTLTTVSAGCFMTVQFLHF